MPSSIANPMPIAWRACGCEFRGLLRSALCLLSATANFTAYHTNSLILEQQAHLAAIAESLVNNRIPVLISNHDTALTREWYSQAKLHVVKVRRSISSNGGTRKKQRMNCWRSIARQLSEPEGFAVRNAFVYTL